VAISDGTPGATQGDTRHPLVPQFDLAGELLGNRQRLDAAADESDGRKARGLRNREAVVDAILELFAEGNNNPTAREIADRANVSLRSVFRHFEDLDSLFLAAIERQATRTAHLYEPPSPAGDVSDRVASLVARRRKLYEAIFDVRRGWMLRYYDHPRVSQILDELYQGLHGQVIWLFADDLAHLDKTTQRDVTDAIDAAASFDMWAHLRSHRNLSATRAASVIRRTLDALLADVLDG
ncbi:MAG TPA: TetR/AcrR family transcriptional regulator, partial [Protaetiibacter sp.]|nr:TetR/AcrR family transcriptional regulator [Protaetiibacter sp.]